MHPLEGSKFLYCLENGTMGLYCKTERVWKKKVKKIKLYYIIDNNINNILYLFIFILFYFIPFFILYNNLLFYFNYISSKNSI